MLLTSIHSNQARIKFSTGQCVQEELSDIAPTKSCHLLLRLAWLHFRTLNLCKGSLYLRHEGHEMKSIFMTPRQASKDQHRLKEKIDLKKKILKTFREELHMMSTILQKPFQEHNSRFEKDQEVDKNFKKN